MSRKYPHEYDYQNYKYEYPEDHISSKRDEYGLYYKKKKEEKIHKKINNQEVILKGSFKVKYEDGSIEEFVINDTEDADREANEIASNSPLAIGASKSKIGDYFSIPGGKVLLLEKYLNSKFTYHNRTNNTNTGKKIESNPTTQSNKNLYTNQVTHKTQGTHNNKVMRTKQETRSYKRTNSNQKRSLNQSTHIKQQTYTNQKINVQKKREQLSKNNNQNKLWNIISVVFVLTCLVLLIVIIFFGRKQPEYIGDHYCMNVEWGEYCVDHRVSNEEIDNSDAWIILISLFIPGVGFVVGISMIPAYGVIPFIIREIFVLIPYLEKKLK